MTEPPKDSQPYTARVAAIFSEISRRLQNPAVPEQGFRPADAAVFPNMLDKLANNPDRALDATISKSMTPAEVGQVEMYSYDPDTRRFEKQILTIPIHEGGQMVLFMEKKPDRYPETRERAVPQLRIRAYSLEPDSEREIRRYYGGAKQLIDIAQETKHGQTAMDWSTILREHVEGMEQNIVVSRTTIAMERIYRPDNFVWEPQASISFIERINGQYEVEIQAQQKQDESLSVTGQDAKALDRWLTKVVSRQPPNR